MEPWLDIDYFRNQQQRHVSSVVSYLWFSLSCKAGPQCVQRLADHCSRAGCQAATHKVNSSLPTVIRRRLVNHLGQKLEAGKLQIAYLGLGGLCVIGNVSYCVNKQFPHSQALPGLLHSRWRGVAPGRDLSRKQGVPPLNKCGVLPEIVPNISPHAFVKTHALSAAVGGNRC